MSFSQFCFEEAISMFGQEFLCETLGVDSKKLDEYSADDSYWLEWVKSEPTPSTFTNYFIIHKEISRHDLLDSRECRSGHVYCVSNGEVMKIGRSARVEKRVHTIKSMLAREGVALKVYISKFMSDCVYMETFLLNYFSEKNIKGELFSCDFESVVKIANEHYKPFLSNNGLRRKKPCPKFVMDSVFDKFQEKNAVSLENPQ